MITDALDMGAISRGVGVEQGAVRSLAAGADALCLGPQVDEAGVAAVHAAIVAAVRSGQLAEARVREAAARVRASRPSLGAAGAPDRELGRSAAARAVTVDGQLATLSGTLDVVLFEPEPEHRGRPDRLLAG